jgi:Mn-dependent DtxR family transcriptional regulator
VAANSVAIDDYLKTIYHHTEWQPALMTSSQLAAELKLAPSTVTEMVQKLVAQGLVDHRPYGPVALTERGRLRAASIIRRHRLIETWLVQEFGYAWDEVHDEAEVLEHTISDRLLAGIAERLGHPRFDPHGDAIPDADGNVAPPSVRAAVDRRGRARGRGAAGQRPRSRASAGAGGRRHRCGAPPRGRRSGRSPRRRRATVACRPARPGRSG